jgi:hypothetical protein
MIGCLHGQSFLIPCAECRVSQAEAIAQYWRDVRAGQHDSQGYTVEERVAKIRRAQLTLFGPEFDIETGATW